MLKWLKFSLFLLSLNLSGVALASDAGEKIFAQCRGCHQVGPDAKHQFGPTLNGVMDNSAARLSDYSYSNAFSKAADGGLVWDDSTMSEFLKAPMQYVAGTKMAFSGIADQNDRDSLIEYLRLFDESGQSVALSENQLSTEQPSTDQPSTEEASASPEKRRLAADFAIPDHGELHLGRIALPEEVAAWDIDIRPDGMGLPEGEGSAALGVEIYDAQCASCHGDFGEGTGRWPVLAGGQDTLTEERPEKTIGSYWPYLSTVYDYVRRAMPFGNARSLSDEEVYALTAYLLYLNDQVEEDFVLSSDNFNTIVMPNQSNFKPDDRSEEAFRSTSEDELCMSSCLEEPAKVVQRARLLNVTPEE